MEDISAKIAQILSDEESMHQIMGMMSLLSGGGEGNVPPDLGSLLSALGGTNSGSQQQGEEEDFSGRQGSAPSGQGGFDPGMLGKMGKMLGQAQQHDKNIELLMALRPYFAEPRKNKVDEAIKLLKVLRLLPLLRESGILDGVLGGENHGG